MLLNLTGNAIKFTERGEVEVKVVLESEQDGMATLLFRVRDTGIGIPRAAGQHFQCLLPGRLLHQSPLRGHRAWSDHQSPPGESDGGYRRHQRAWQRSEFWFRVRLEQVERPEALNERLQHISLLIADDNQVTRDALSMTVGSLGWQSRVVESGEQALHHLLRQGSVST